MSAFLTFITGHYRLLTFGILLAFFSSYGQTFLVSLYIPQIEAAFGFSNTTLSALYAAATMGSALTLPWIGRKVDVVALKRFATGVVLGCALACVILSLAHHTIVVLLGFFGLRLFGQGLLSHTSVSTMARAFELDRGKAISIAGLGHPLGEALLPIMVAFAISYLGWRSTLQISSLVLLGSMLPLIFILLSAQPAKILHPAVLSSEQLLSQKNPLRLLRDGRFWIIAPVLFMLGFLSTAIFFFQIKLGNSRGWDPTWVAGSLSIYALANALAMMLSGPMIDRLTAQRVFPYILIPFTLGFLLLAFSHHTLVYPAALALLGLSNGAGSTTINALFAEVFGSEMIGTVRSVFATVMVFSTALGPISFGLLLDASWSYQAVFLLSSLGLVMAMGASFFLRR
ncbi:MAG: MFS transporter [Saprospiraceae bacterium]|nr:MFS transporter [Saprospiraceae bacterium]